MAVTRTNFIVDGNEVSDRRRTIRDIAMRAFSPRWSMRAGSLVACTLLAACANTPVTRQGAPQRYVVARTWDISGESLRRDVLEAFTNQRSRLPPPFDQMLVNELRPPRYSPDWAV